MSIAHLAEQALALIPAQKADSPQFVRPVPGLALLKHHRPTTFESCIYQPVVCLILQGRKDVTMGENAFAMNAGDCLLVSHDLPVVARVPKAPYLALLLDLDVAALRTLYDEVADDPFAQQPVRSIEVHKAGPALIESMGRYLSLTSSPLDARVLGPMISKEIHYRLLTTPFGGMLRRLLRRDSSESAITRAIAQIRRDFRSPIAIPALARGVGMSVSSFHKHFREVTASTPLQYQKELRMLAARQLLITRAASVSSAAFEVGYESPNQFSREYARKFGVPPSKDAA